MDISTYRRQLEGQTKELLLDLWNGQNDGDNNPLMKAWIRVNRKTALGKIPALIQTLQELQKYLIEGGVSVTMAASYKTKKLLKAAVGQRLRYVETSILGPEYRSNGKFAVVGPSPTERKWYAEVTMENDVIKKVE